ncbi:MAG: toll/interleukin-1 receptor domain-containing protein [Sulfurimonas sp.]|jgi:hypothetical protein
MKVIIYKENDVEIELKRIIERINSITTSLQLNIGNNIFNYDKRITENNFEKYISNDIINETKNFDFSILITNGIIKGGSFYFSNKKGRIVLLSFYDWNNLTNYSKNTGLVYFIADLLSLEIDENNPRHNNKSTSCIYGFGTDKKDIDKMIQDAIICDECQSRISDSDDKEFEDILSDIVIILEEIKKSNSYNDIIEYWKTNQKEKVKIFFSYAHKDREYLEELKEYIKIFERNGLVERWDDNELVVGEKWDNTIKDKIYSADIIIFLLSSTSLASDYIYNNELKIAFELNEMDEAYVVPIIIKDCLWDMTEFKEFQVLPLDGIAVNSWSKKEEAWTRVSRGLKKAIDNIISAKQNSLEKLQDFRDIKSDTKISKIIESIKRSDSEEEIILKFLKIYSRWWFNIPRIINWGSERDGFRILKNISSSELEIILESLEKQGQIISKSSIKNKNKLYRIK